MLMMSEITNYIAFLIRWGRSNAMMLAALTVVWLLAILLALLWPLADQADIAADNRNSAKSGPSPRMIAPSEDLAAFVESGRWGTSLQDVMKLNEAIQPSALNPVLQEMGYVGFISSGNQSDVLLMLPEGTTSRLKVGDTLPDGRYLKDIKENSITLVDAQKNIEVLLLFPEINAGSKSVSEKYSKEN